MRTIVRSLIVLASLASVPAAATTFVMISDEDLVDLAPAVVEARVVSRDSSPASGMPATDYMVEVDRVLKGSIPGSTLIVRVPGGIRSDGLGFHVFGAPEFRVGDRALLFLGPAGDGTFRLFHLMLGAFHTFDVGGERLALRNFAETREVEIPGQPRSSQERQRTRAPRRLEAFASWIADRARGERRLPDYFLATSEEELRAQAGAFTLFEDRDTGRNMRWFFDLEDVVPVPWRAHQDGQPGLSMQQVETAVRRGTGVWSNIPGTDIRYRYAGTTTATGGLTDFDFVNALQFEDPNGNPLFEGVFSCVSGGVLALGGPWFTSSTTLYQGTPHHRIAGGDIITNKGLKCFFDTSPNRQAAADELFAHELGHTLGFGHSCADGASGPCDTALKNEALMRATVHDDGRGARVNDDDRAAARALYASSGRPAAPSNLAAKALSSSAIELTWRDNSGNEDAFEVQMRQVGGVFETIISFLPPDTEITPIVGLMPQTSYEFRVRAVNEFGASGFSNVASATTLPAVPDAPSRLRAVPVSETQILLDWRDNSDDELNFEIEITTPAQDAASVNDRFVPAGVASAGAEQFTVSGLQPDTPYSFRVRATNGVGPSLYSNEASATTQGAEGPCVADAETLCLLGDRFRVQVQWRNQRIAGDHGVGNALVVPGSNLSGMFWFFDPSNVELIVKMLDGTSLNSFYWTFYGALSDVEYWITVTDTENGVNVTYHNLPANICGLGDVRSFPRVDDPVPAPESPQLALRGASAGLRLPLGAPGTTDEGTCEPGPTTLCLLDNRFEVEVVWENPRAPFNSGSGSVRDVATVPSDATGFFWFFSPSNIELVVKVLDARVINGHFWFFWGALSDVEYTIIVTDTVTGTPRVYSNPAFNLCGGADNEAF